MEEYRSFIKRNKIKQEYLMRETGYSRQHLSRVLNNRLKASSQFIKLLELALKNFSEEKKEANRV